MVQGTNTETGKVYNEEYHRIRWEAESETFSIDEWSDIDQERYDLDTVDFTRKYKESEYITDTRVESEGAAKSGKDMRQIPELE